MSRYTIEIYLPGSSASVLREHTLDTPFKFIEDGHVLNVTDLEQHSMK